MPPATASAAVLRRSQAFIGEWVVAFFYHRFLSSSSSCASSSALRHLVLLLRSLWGDHQQVGIAAHTRLLFCDFSWLTASFSFSWSCTASFFFLFCFFLLFRSHLFTVLLPRVIFLCFALLSFRDASIALAARFFHAAGFRTESPVAPCAPASSFEAEEDLSLFSHIFWQRRRDQK